MSESSTPSLVIRPAGSFVSAGDATTPGNCGGGTRVVRALARVLVADVHPMLRRGIRAVLDPEPDLTLAAEAGSPRLALAAARRIRPDLVVTEVDFGVDQQPRLDLIRALRTRHPSIRVVVFTGRRNRDTTAELMRLGVHGYLDKRADPDHLVHAIRAVLAGQGVFETSTGFGTGSGTKAVAPGVEPEIVVDTAEAPALDTAPLFTTREHEVLALIAIGLSNREIGKQLGVSEATVKFHLRNLQNKLNVRGRSKIAYLAVRHQLI